MPLCIGEYINAIRQAQLAPFRAKRDGASAVAFPPELQALRANPEVAVLMRAQESLFQSLCCALAS